MAALAGHVFEQRPGTLWENVSRGGQRGHHWFAGENPPTIEPTSSLPRARFRNNVWISYWLKPEPGAEATLEIADIGRSNTRLVSLDPAPGIHRYLWDLRFDPPALGDEQVTEVTAALEAMASGGGRGARGRGGRAGNRRPIRHTDGGVPERCWTCGAHVTMLGACRR